MKPEMITPVCDFAKRYAKSDVLRLHMPGHKGAPLLGCEALDLTEIKGADSLFEADGIIAESEANASALFGCKTYYSTEGSSLCIRAMLALVAQNVCKRGEKCRILAGRNAHKCFLSAAALLDLDITWLCPEEGDSYLSCAVTAEHLAKTLDGMPQKPAAVYVTSPDYLGNTVDVRSLAEVCHANGIYLLVDNAHGAYLKFLTPSQHPIDLGADLCCDSAHKTLPVLTGGAYLHVSDTVCALFADNVKKSMMLFGSTSPSYLILQSLDAANAYLAENKDSYATFARLANDCREKLSAYTFIGGEPLKWTLSTKPYGYLGVEFSDILRVRGVECEFADPDYVVLMLSPTLGAAGVERLTAILANVPKKEAITSTPPAISRAERALSVREAMLSPCELLPVAECEGRILADAGVGCPPAVPILVCGERIDRAAIEAFSYYGVTSCNVVK